MIAVVGVREHVLKSSKFSAIAATLKHYREISSKRKRSYIEAFPRRYFRFYSYIEIARVYAWCSSTIEKIDNLLKELRPALVIVDDSICNIISYPRKIRESLAKRRHEEYLKKVADNLANYFRILLKNNPKKFREELKRFEK